MKNKKVTYLLGVLVLVVWGVIIYRIFQSANLGDDTDFQPANNKMAKEAYNDYTVPKDTASLQLNYKDPFVAQKQKDTSDHPVKKTADKMPLKPLPAMNWNFIKYAGYIHNPGSKNLVALITINGKSVMMTEGETSEQVKLLKNLKDSIQIVFNGKTTFIKMRQSAL